MKPTLQLKMGQSLTMTPQLQQAIRLLQLSSVDLLTEIENILTDNPLLERSDDEHAQSAQIHLWETWGKNVKHSQQDEDSEHELYQKAREMNLQEYLTWQMELTHFSPTDQIIAASIIDAINDEGFLELELSDLHASLSKQVDIELTEIEAVLHRIQQFDPLGVGSRNLKECLLVQVNGLIRSNEIETTLANKLILLINQFLPLVAKQDLVGLKKKLKLTQPELKILIDKLKTLYPKPGLLIGSKTAEYIIPDLITFKQGGEWIVELNPEATPKIQLNESYTSYIKQCKKPEEVATLKNRAQEAKWFLKSLETRHDTLLKVAKCIVSKQIGFLESGEEALRPMILQDIAQEVSLHESTVSRVTTQKFIHTPRGTFELKYFFSTLLLSQDGQDFSAKAIKAMIKKTIQQETLNKPFSDSFLADKLNQLGVPVARRTVSKYREQLGIPASNERKRLI
jgi:RNA polymerase sigma-54 factor